MDCMETIPTADGGTIVLRPIPPSIHGDDSGGEIDALKNLLQSEATTAKKGKESKQTG